MIATWKGCFVKESLNDENILKSLKPIRIRVTEEPIPSDRWHIYEVNLSEKEINNLHQRLKEGWFMHFWQENKMIVLFKDRKFILNINNKETHRAAIEYGLSVGIPKEQLDFKIEF